MSNEHTTAPVAEGTISPPNPSGHLGATNSMIERPNHYVGKDGLEAITVIRAFGLDESFELGSATKYLLRWNAKGSTVENIKKARQMLDMWLAENADKE